MIGKITGVSDDGILVLELQEKVRVRVPRAYIEGKWEGKVPETRRKARLTPDVVRSLRSVWLRSRWLHGSQSEVAHARPRREHLAVCVARSRRASRARTSLAAVVHRSSARRSTWASISRAACTSSTPSTSTRRSTTGVRDQARPRVALRRREDVKAAVEDAGDAARRRRRRRSTDVAKREAVELRSRPTTARTPRTSRVRNSRPARSASGYRRPGRARAERFGTRVRFIALIAEPPPVPPPAVTVTAPPRIGLLAGCSAADRRHARRPRHRSAGAAAPDRPPASTGRAHDDPR